MKLIFTLFIFLPFISIAQSPVYDNLNVNNIDARYYSAGMMFMDTSTGTSDFEFMQGSGQSTIYAANLWIGGKDSNGQLHMAGQTFGVGKDFYPGPVSDAQYYPGTHTDWNYVWKVTRQEIAEYTTWFNCTQDPNCNPNPSYIIPDNILNWPAHGDVSKGQQFFIAPFYDYLGDGIYDPINGDRPCIKGDLALFTVFNDDYTHTETGGDSLRLEIHVMHYAYNSTDSALANTIFSEYSLYNFSNQTFTDMYVGIWEDMDIGCSEDDYVGCDVERSLGFSINADAIDDAGCNGAAMFGAQPPAQGVVVLKGPKQNDDQIANSIGIGANESINGCGYGDTIKDNERLGLGKFVYLDRTLPSNIYGDPVNTVDYYNYLNGYWLDGSQITYGGTGHGGAQPADYCFPDSSDANYYSGTAGNSVAPWSELGQANPMGDRRLLMSMGTFEMIPFNIGAQITGKQDFTIAHITARDYSGGSVPNSLSLLKSYTDEVKNFYGCDSSGVFASCYQEIQLMEVNEEIKSKVTVSPNPTSGVLNFSSEKQLERIKVYNILGKIVLSDELQGKHQIILSELPNGVYLVEFEFQNGVKSVQRVVKK